jgi:hypothetical protein
MTKKIVVSSFGRLVDLFVSAIFLFILYSTYQYLGNLKNCSCVVNQASVSHLKNVELFFVVVAAIGLIVKLLSFIFNFSIFNLLSKNKIMMALAGIYSMFLFFLMFYFLYNSYQFIFSTLKDCKCAQSWQEYFIYLQTFLYSMSILAIIVLMFFRK